MKAVHRRKALASRGQVKQARPHGYVSPCYRIDMGDPANQLATWEHYQWNYKKNGYVQFLGVTSKARQFTTEFGLLGPTNNLVPFILLLIEQHPLITESFLLGIELFDKNGKAKGFRQSGQSWIIDSVKLRRGARLAQQIVILNDTSKLLIESILLYTKDAREWLKEQGSDDWRYLFLASKTGLSKPFQIKRIHAPSGPNMNDSPLVQALLTPTSLVNAETAEEIKNNLGCDSMRASCAVCVYLKTKSVKAMSEALGHENYNPKLLSSYLPAPILDYFQSRWVSIFQNALIYEAMKDSEYLLDAIDITEVELDTFLRNHALKPLPEHVSDGQINDLMVPEGNDESDIGIITVSVPLLKILNALVFLVDNAPKNQQFTKIAVEWYEAASFIKKSIQAGVLEQSVLNAMTDAEAFPLAPEHLLGAVYA